MQDLNDMLTFAKVVQAKGFTKAAQLLGLPKSNVSRRVSRLESALGVKLLERSTRVLHLTELGQEYYHYCQQMVEQAQMAQAAVQEKIHKVQGTLRVSTSVALGQQLLTPILPGFLAAFSDLKLDLQMSNRQVDIIEEGFDVVIRVGDLADSNLVSRYLGQCRLNFYASQSYVEQYGMVQMPLELTDHRLLLMRDSITSDNLLLNGPRGAEKVLVSPYVQINDFQSLHQLTRQGVGISVLPHYLCRDELKSGQMLCVLPDWQLSPAKFHALYPSRGGKTLKLKVFLDYLAENLAMTLAD